MSEKDFTNQDHVFGDLGWSDFTEKDVLFGPTNFKVDEHTPIGPNETGAFELLGNDETMTVGEKFYYGPGIVTVYRWANGSIASQIERPNGEFEGGQ